MKKQLTAILTTVLLLTVLTGCTDGTVSDGSSDISSDLPMSSLTSSDTQSSEASGNSSTDSTTSPDKEKEMVRVNYGEVEIPDIHCETADEEGKIRYGYIVEPEGLINSMVFETHTFGEYTFTLIGEGVRTDVANFPDSIYAKNIYVEACKNGKPIDGEGYLTTTFYGISDTKPEYVLQKDKIGSYLKVYELDRPVIALRYYLSKNTPSNDSNIKGIIHFIDIFNDELCDGHVNLHAAGTGLASDSGKILANDKETNCKESILFSDELTIIDGKTLEDKEAGVRYNFNFTDSPEMLLYTTALI